jgi:hypothetical protein
MAEEQHRKTWLGMPVNWDWQNWSKGVWNAEAPFSQSVL